MGSPSKVKAWVPPQYCVDPETLNPELVLSDYFEGCNLEVYTDIIPRFILPVGYYLYVVAEFYIDIAEKNYD